MKGKLQINMLGGFEVIVDGKRIDHKQGRSKKSWFLLKCLLLHRNEAMSYANLYNIMWPDKASMNPENALKTQISRVRSFLNECSDGLGDCIATSRGAYRWNREVKCRSDVFDFSKIAGKILSQKTYVPELDALVDEAISLYKGDLLRDDGDESWLSERREALHEQYIRMVAHYLNLVEDKRPSDELAEILVAALKIDPENTAFLMALDIERGKTDSRPAKDQGLFGEKRTDAQMLFKAHEFRRQSLETSQLLDADIDRIREELSDISGQRGAYICDYAVFKEIYLMQIRNLERIGVSLFSGLIMVTGSDGRAIEFDELSDIMRDLLRALRENLRKGDTISQYGALEYVILLPTVTHQTGAMVMERVKKAFEQIHPDTSITCDYRIGPLKSIKG